MPALDKLQAELGGPDFQVVAINVDTRNPDKPKAWLQENGIGNLAYHADPDGKLLQVLQKSGHVVGLPTTFVVDGSGCEIALLKGPGRMVLAGCGRLHEGGLGTVLSCLAAASGFSCAGDPPPCGEEWRWGCERWPMVSRTHPALPSPQGGGEGSCAS